MDESSAASFLDTWHIIMIIGAILFGILSVVQVVYHFVKVNGLSDLKEKYDYIRENEIRNFQRAFLFLAIAIACIINTYGMGSMTFHPIWFFVRIFMGIAGAVLIGYIAQLILQYYYPTPLHNKLQKLRYTPRTNPENGNKMRLLGEHEEDVHLEEGMQAEENIFSVDYDVWVDEETGYTKIEKYPGHLDALQCGNCGFYTLKVVREEITKPPTAEEDGELIKHYECEYCHSIRATAFHIVRDVNRSYGPQDHFYSEPGGVSMVRVEVITNDGERRIYEFQGIDQAEKFLQEYKAG